MKRFLIILLLPLALLASCSREEVEETPLYSQFAARENLTVAQITGFQLSDAVKVDVVILVADDTAAWSSLKEEFDIRATEGVTSWMGDIEQPQQRVKRSELPAWRALAVHDEMTVAFYRILDSVQYQALVDYQLDKLNSIN